MTLTWSISRDTTLDTCERRYFYQYVAAARLNSADARLREIALLKKVQNLAMWQGDMFHGAAADYLRMIRAGAVPDDQGILKRLRARMTDQWHFSAAKRYRSDHKALARGAGLVLFEHEYGGDVDPAMLSEAIERVSAWFTHFTAWVRALAFISTVRSASQVWIEPQVFGPDAPGFPLRGTQVLTKVDLAVRGRDGQFDVYDWKTGAVPAMPVSVADDADYQVAIYQLWPHLRLGIPLEAIRGHLVYVSTDPAVVRSFSVDENACARAMRRVARGIARARALQEGDGRPALQETDFDLAPHVALCRWCCFKRLCQRMLDE